MDEASRSAVVTELSTYPSDIREAPATERELQAFETALGSIPPDVRWFLSTCGGGVVGRERLDGVQNLWRSHEKYLKECGPPSGWSMDNVFVIGWDGAGNPIAVHRKTGQVLVEDHDFGGIHVEAESFGKYLEKLLFPKRG